MAEQDTADFPPESEPILQHSLRRRHQDRRTMKHPQSSDVEITAVFGPPEERPSSNIHVHILAPHSKQHRK